MKKFELDLDRLHNVYFNGGGRRSGKTILWCYELLGLGCMYMIKLINL